MAFRNLVVCDVQEHDVGTNIKFNLRSFARYVNGFDRVLVFFNGEDYDWESADDMRDFYEGLGIDVGKCEFFDKGYGFFRDPLDGLDVDVGELAVTVKAMVDSGLRDSRDLTESMFESSPLRDYVEFDDLKNYPFWDEPEIASALERYDGFTLIGGARNECLKELRVLCESRGLDYDVDYKFVYGT